MCAVVAAATLGAASPAGAQPTAIDLGRLPPAGPAAPLEPTTQRQACTTAVALDATDDNGLTSVGTTPPAQRALGYTDAWQHSRGAGQVVAVIDTGVSPHPQLPGMKGGGDYVSTGDGTEDCDAHGTLVAGIIAAAPDPSGATAFAGVAPGATVLSLRQSSVNFGRLSTANDPEGGNYGNVRTLAMAVRRAADLGASVINISEVACVDTAYNLDDSALGAALAYAVDTKDVVVVAAAGNVSGGSCATQNPDRDPTDPRSDGWDALATIATPAWYDDLVLTVGAVNLDGSPAEFSLAGPWVDIAAPGTNIVSLAPNGQGLVNAVVNGSQLAPIQGTSYAAPYVAGTAALVRARYPHLSAREVMRRIVATAHAPAQGWNPQVGYGVVDPVAAVSDKIDSAALTNELPRTIPQHSQPIAPPTPAASADNRPREIAVTVSAACLVALGLGYFASLPLRRRR